MDMKENEDRMGRTLDALEHPGRFTKEELEELLADRECVAACRDLLDCREALARRHAAAPDVDGQWEAFCRRHPDAAGAARGRKRMRRAAWWTALAVAASLALLMMLPLTGRREYTVFRAGPAGGEVKAWRYPYGPHSPGHEPPAGAAGRVAGVAQCGKLAQLSRELRRKGTARGDAAGGGLL